MHFCVKSDVEISEIHTENKEDRYDPKSDSNEE